MPTSAQSIPDVGCGVQVLSLMQYLNDELLGCLDAADLYGSTCRLKGKVYRQVAGRKTIRFVWKDRGYFAKTHSGVGWLEIFKNLIQLRLPVLGAANEWHALKRLKSLGIETMEPVAYISQGRNPARIQSSIVTRELENTMSLEEFCANEVVSVGLKYKLLSKLASVSRVLHENGVNHRDYYICHFLMDLASLNAATPVIYLIDLHRAQIRTRTPRRWRVKDVGGLFFSALDLDLTQRDLYRFMKVYSGRSLRETLHHDKAFWQQVVHRARLLYEQDGKSVPRWFQVIQHQVY